MVSDPRWRAVQTDRRGAIALLPGVVAIVSMLLFVLIAVVR